MRASAELQLQQQNQQSQGGQGDQPMRVGDWICAGCGSFQFKKNPTCRKCGRTQDSSVGPDVKRAAQSVQDITVDGPPWKKAKIPFLPPGLSIKNGMVCVDKPPQFVKVLKIPAEERGGLIGRKGIVIEQIRRDTKAYIKVECEKGDEFAVITIKGKQEEVELAERTIQAKLAELNMPGTKHEENWMVGGVVQNVNNDRDLGSTSASQFIVLTVSIAGRQTQSQIH